MKSVKSRKILMKSCRGHLISVASVALLASCIESEEDLLADSLIPQESTLRTEAGDEGSGEATADATGEATAAATDEDETSPPLSADRADLPPFVPYEVIVKFRDPSATSGTRANLSARAQLEGITDDTNLVRFADETGGRRSARDANAVTWAYIDELRSRDDVEYAHPNWLFEFSLAPNDRYYPNQWHYPQVNLPAAWDLTTGSPTVRIAILDSGRTEHPDEFGRYLTGVEYDAMSEDGDAKTSSDYNHHVAVASIAGGRTNNSKHSAGVCWGCQLLNVNMRSGGSTTMVAVARGMRWAVDNGARVINMSFENDKSCTKDGGIPLLKESVEYAASKNVVLVAAAGNTGANATDTSPASCPGVIAVAATDQSKALAKYSNHTAVTLAAPGGGASLVNGKIGSDAYGKALELDEICGADADSGFSPSTSGVVVNWTTSTGNHCDRYMAGTSFSAPHVAGVVGLMLSRNPSLTPAQIKSILQSTATPMPNCNGKCGAGLLNAFAAVKAVAPLPVNDPKPTANFTVQCTGLQCTFNGGSSTDNSSIVAYEWILPTQQFRMGSVVNAFMPGYGSKSAQLRVTDNRGQSMVITKNFSISQPAVTPVAGQYHNPERPDNRLEIFETSDSGLVVAWYTFDRSGNPIWYTSGAGLRFGARWTQPLYKTIKNNGVGVTTQVGTVSLDFSSSSTVWFSWSINDLGVFDNVVGGERFTFLFGNQGRSGSWFSPMDPGWGISVHESGQQLETALGFHLQSGMPSWARSQRLTPSGNMSVPLSVYKGRGLCPSCGGKSAASVDSGFGGSMTLQIANGSVTAGTASVNITYGGGLGSFKKPLQIINLLTKP